MSFYTICERPPACRLSGLDGLPPGAGLGVLGAALFGSIYWVSRLIPEPWDGIAWVAGFMLTPGLGLASARSETRRIALRRWGSTKTDRAPELPVLVLLADGDEALLVLKIAEGVTPSSGGCGDWQPSSRFECSRSSAALAMTCAWRSRCTGAAAVGVLIWLLRNDVGVMSFGLVLKAIAGALVVPGAVLLAWSLLLALPALLITPFGFLGLGLLRWVAFGWRAPRRRDDCRDVSSRHGDNHPARTAPGPRGLRHGYSYDHRRAPVHIARFICRTLGHKRRRDLASASIAANPG